MQVSIIMPIYNAEAHLAEAIESVLAQSYADFELIAVDDGSTDGSLSILQIYAAKDSRLKVISQPNCGAGEARNRAMALCQNDWVFLMDADDVMLPHRLERQLDFLRENPDVVVCSCRATYINSKGDAGGRTTNTLRAREDYQRHVNSGEVVGLLNPGVLLHRPSVLAVGGFRGQFFPAEDIDLWNRLIERGHLILIQDEVLMKYRIHGGSAVTANFFRCRQKYEWVRSCIAARREARPEPTWEEFLIAWNSTPWLQKMNRWRKIRAKQYYRQAGQSRVDRKYLSLFISVSFAALLQPEYTFARLKNQLAR